MWAASVKVVRCVSSADVAAAVDFAKQSDLEIGVRCGGHSVLGISVPDGRVLIDLSGDCGGASQHSVAAWRQHR
jgi:FAD/FMN-containing dehydrogenase